MAGRPAETVARPSGSRCHGRVFRFQTPIAVLHLLDLNQDGLRAFDTVAGIEMPLAALPSSGPRAGFRRGTSRLAQSADRTTLLSGRWVECNDRSMEPFLGQLVLVPYDFAPTGWALCNGQLLPIAENQALFALLGTTYGGDGVTTFALPDLRGRVPVSSGQGPGLSSYIVGETYGAESVTLNTSQIPSHTHPVNCDSVKGKAAEPTGRYPGEASTKIYAGNANAQMNAGMIGGTGGGAPHENRQPSLVLNWIIALQGVFPSRP